MRLAREKAISNRSKSQKLFLTRLEKNPALNPLYVDGATSDFCVSDHPDFGHNS